MSIVPLETPFALLRPTSALRQLGRTAVLTAFPHGGQGTARRNAWAAMSADAARGRARREAETAMRDAAVRDGRRRAAPGR